MTIVPRARRQVPALALPVAILVLGIMAPARALELPPLGGEFAHGSPTGPFTYETKLERSSAGRNGASAILVHLTIPKDTHLSADGGLPRIEPSTPPPGIHFGSLETPPPATTDLDLTPQEKDPAKKLYEKGLKVYLKEATLRLPFTVAEDAAPGPRHILATLKYSGCQDRPQYQCFVPAQISLDLPFTVTDATETAAPSASPEPPAPGSPAAAPSRGGTGELAQAFTSGHISAFLWGLFLAGLASFLLPCVYPLVPITLGVIGVKQTATRSQAAALAGSYGLGIIAVYVLLGLISGLAGGQFDQFVDRPWVVLAIAALCAALAFSLFGAFELELPGVWKTRLARFGGAGYAGGFAMGAVSGLLSSACVAPALIFVLLLIAQQGSAALGALSLFVYGLGFALPYVVLGATAARLPKPGAWMVTVKKAGGLILLGVSIYYASKVIPEWVTLLLAGGAAVTVGVFAGAFDTLTAESSAWPRAMKSFGIIAVALGLFSFVGTASKLGLLGMPSFAPASGPEIAWQTNVSQGLEFAARERRPAILDFVSDTCTVCKEIEKTTFRDPRVVENSKDFVMIKVDTSDGRHEDLTRRYRVKGLPTILFMDRAGRERDELAVLGGYVGADEFLAKMSEALPLN